MFDSPAFDLKKTLTLVKGSLFDHEATARDYRQQDPGWMQTFLALTLPVIVAAFVLGALLAWIFDSISMYSMLGGFGVFLRTLVWSVVSFFIFAFIAAFLAGTFGGVNNFNRAFGLASLVGVVLYTGSVLGALPWLGWLLGLAMAIWGLVLFYRDVPLFLDVPQAKRMVHFVVTIVVMLVINILVSLALGGGNLADRMTAERLGQQDADSGEGGPLPESGVMGLIGQQAATAMQDRFEPPADGNVSNAQIRQLLRFMEQTRDAQREIAAELEAIANQNEGGVGDVLAGMNKTADLTTMEMRVVKDGGGNWAEHQWVKQQLAIARSLHNRGQGGGPNYELYREYEDEFEELAAFSLYE